MTEISIGLNCVQHIVLDWEKSVKILKINSSDSSQYRTFPEGIPRVVQCRRLMFEEDLYDVAYLIWFLISQGIADHKRPIRSWFSDRVTFYLASRGQFRYEDLLIRLSFSSPSESRVIFLFSPRNHLDYHGKRSARFVLQSKLHNLYFCLCRIGRQSCTCILATQPITVSLTER